MNNAGRFNHLIRIFQTVVEEDSAGFQTERKEITVLTPFAEIKTTKGMTIIKNDSDFEKALTRFVIRYPQNTCINRDMLVEFRGKTYSIEYLNNIDEESKYLELQCKEITH